MVVVLIIGILIAIALPTFLGARQRAEARAAQSSVRNALVAAKTSYTDVDSYNNVTGATTCRSIEPSLTYQAGASTGPTVVSFEIALNGATTNQEIGLAAMANSGTCYLLARRGQRRWYAHPAGTSYGSTNTAGELHGNVRAEQRHRHQLVRAAAVPERVVRGGASRPSRPSANTERAREG